MCTMNLCFSSFWMVLKVCPPRKLPMRVISYAGTYSWLRMPISIAARIRSYSREMKCRYWIKGLVLKGQASLGAFVDDYIIGI
jgi:hypothetical protein